MTPLAITGLGVVSALGDGWELFRANLGDRSYDPLRATSSLFDLGAHPGTRVAEVPAFDAAKTVGEKGLRNNDRLTRLYLVASRHALVHAGLKRDGAWRTYGPDDVGVVAANAYGSIEAIHEVNAVALREDPRYINPSRFPNTVINSSLGYVSIWDDLRAINATVVNGPVGALEAVTCADIYLSTGRAKAAVVGGGEALAELLHLALDRVGMLARAGERAGAHSGEGAAMMVIEPIDAARARGATCWAAVTGYGTAFEAPDDLTTLCAPSQLALERAIGDALVDAGVRADEVDLVVTGLSGWSHTDEPERAALRAVMGDTVCMAAPKQRVGETLGASGALAMAATVAWMHGTPLTCTVQGTVPSRMRTVLVTAMGFYGNASAVVLRRAEDVS